MSIPSEPEAPVKSPETQGWGPGDRLAQYLLPHHLLSAIMQFATRIRFKPWKNWQIRWFVKRYGVDLKLAVESKAEGYQHFNQFFTRALRPDVRPINHCAGLVSPSDGIVSECGSIESGQLIQAKGLSYSVEALLADETHARQFSSGAYATVYLSPKDYHRVHAPCAGKLEEMVYIPGRLFSVKPNTVQTIPNLFARNERVISIFNTKLGKLAVVMVGAVFVGSIEHTWHGLVTSPRRKQIQRWQYHADERPQFVFQQGDEIGQFNMGSTVVVLAERSGFEWRATPGSPIRMGNILCTLPDE